MYLSYADESGFSGMKFDCKQPVQVMVAIFPNMYNFHKTDSEFKEIFNIINKKIPIEELKGEQIYRGKGAWKTVVPQKRDQVIEFYLKWVMDRNHKLIVTCIDNEKYFNLKAQEPNNNFIQKIPYPYLLSGLHTALIIQKLNRNQGKNKGKTLLIFDEQDQFSNTLTELIFNPPSFIDEFVSFSSKKDIARLNQIIDSAFFVKSHHSSMAQVADIVAYLYRMKLELDYYGRTEQYDGEKSKIATWAKQIESKIVPFNVTYPTGKKPFLLFLNSVKAIGV